MNKRLDVFSSKPQEHSQRPPAHSCGVPAAAARELRLSFVFNLFGDEIFALLIFPGIKGSKCQVLLIPCHISGKWESCSSPLPARLKSPIGISGLGQGSFVCLFVPLFVFREDIGLSVF